MDYRQFEGIFNETIFEKSKPDLIRKIAIYPERYVGLFRPTKPRAKIIQNLLQSHEIRFGDAFETVITEYLRQSGFSILNSRFTSDDGNVLELDQVFSIDDRTFFVEQKIRDDHDSTKKRGQIDNFERKVAVIIREHNGSNIEGFFYFIDDSFRKNQNYYTQQIEELSADYGITLYLSYGHELFSQIGISAVWDQILNHLTSWKRNIPDLPEINFDKNPEDSVNEIKQLTPDVFRKLLSNPNLDGLLRVLFPERQTLNLLAIYFEEKYQSGGVKIYLTLKTLCEDTINRLEEH